MRQKQDDQRAVEKPSGTSSAGRGASSARKTKSALYCRDFEARTASRSCAAARGCTQNQYYRWSKEFLEAGRKRLAGDIEREATSGEVKTLRDQAVQLKEALAEAMLENRLLKKSMIGDGESDT